MVLMPLWGRGLIFNMFLIGLIKSIVDLFMVKRPKTGTLKSDNIEGETMTDIDYKKLCNKFCIPVWKKFRISSVYGPRVLENGDDRFHHGIDFVSETGCNDVFAVYDGIVTYDQDNYDHDKRWLKGHTGGNMIILKHRIDGKIYYSRYLHLGKNCVSVGDIVYKGGRVGVYGDYGYSFGAHLHFDVSNEKWVKIDPTSFF